MSSTKLGIVGNCLWNYYNKNIKKPKVPMVEKITFEKINPFDWENGKCAVCTFPLNTDIRGLQVR